MESSDEISQYIHKYVMGSATVPESTTRKYLRNIFQLGAVALGAVAGTPYIAVGYQAAESMLSSASPLGDLIAIGVVVSFGVTTLWTFFEVSSSLEPQPNEVYTIQTTQNRAHTYLEHALCHGFGIFGMIPAAYIGAKYNNGMLPVFIASVVQYGYTTLGSYMLKDAMVLPMIDYFRRQPAPTRNAKAGIITAISGYLLPHYLARTSRAEMQKDLQLVNNSHSIFQANRIYLDTIHEALQTPQLKNNNNCPPAYRKLYAWPIYLLYPQLNLIYTTAVVYNALLSINHSNLFAITFTPILALPFYGLDVFTAKSVVGLIDARVGRKCEMKRTVSYVKSNHPTLYYLIPIAAIVLAMLSAVTDAFVAFNEVGSSHFSRFSLIFAISVWIAKTILQSIGFTGVSYQLVKKVDAITDPIVDKYFTRINHTEKLAGILAKSRDDIFETFRGNHHEQIEEIENTLGQPN